MLFFFKYSIFITGDEISSTVSHSAVTVIKVLNCTNHLEERRSSSIPETVTNIENILEHRIQTNWQFMVIITCVLIALTIGYLGRCVHRQWKSRVPQVSNRNTAAQNTAFDENHQIEIFYDEIQNTDYEDPGRYRTVEFDNNSGNVINTSQEKMDSVSIIPVKSSLEPSTDQAFNGKYESETFIYENQPELEKREIDDLYLTPTM